MAHDVMLPRGLVGMGFDTLDQSGEEIAQALRAFTEPKSLPILVHCTQGKDRTGLTVALCLLVLGTGAVPLDAVAHDYMLTQPALNEEAPPEERAARLAEIEEIGLTPAWGDCPPDFVAQVAGHLQDRYGGVDKYLDGIGFGEKERNKFRELLLA